MNEFLFFAHIFCVILFTLTALRLGRSALFAFIVLQALFANLFVVKQISLFGFTVTCSDVFAVSSILGVNLLQEFYGKKLAKKAVHTSFFVLIFFTIMTQFHLFYQPSPFDQTQHAFLEIFSHTPRIVIASLTVFYLVQRWDVFFFHFLKKQFSQKSLSFRMGCSLLVAQLFDTILFSFAGLYGIVSSIGNIIILSYAIKVLVISCSTPFLFLAKRFHKEEAVV